MRHCLLQDSVTVISAVSRVKVVTINFMDYLGVIVVEKLAMWAGDVPVL